MLDRETVEALLDAGFTFSSPLDDKIDKACYFERCWTGGDQLSAHQIEKLFAKGDEVSVIYSWPGRMGRAFEIGAFPHGIGTDYASGSFFGSETAATLREVEIRALLNEISAAMKAKDAAALVAHHAPDVLAFDG